MKDTCSGKVKAQRIPHQKASARVVLGSKMSNPTFMCNDTSFFSTFFINTYTTVIMALTGCLKQCKEGSMKTIPPYVMSSTYCTFKNVVKYICRCLSVVQYSLLYCFILCPEFSVCQIQYVPKYHISVLLLSFFLCIGLIV